MKLYKLVIFILTIALQSHLYAQKKENVFDRAVKYYFQKKFAMAEILLQETIKKNPENSLAYSYLGDIYLTKKKYDGALNLYDKAIELDPTSAENYFRIGQVYYYKKIGNLAVENFQKALLRDDKLKIALYQMGLAYLMLLRNKEKTIESWDQFLRAAPEDPQYDKIRRVLELLKDPNFKIPPKGSDISIEEALLLGGSILDKKEHRATNRKEGHEKKKSKTKIEDIYMDDDL